MTVWLGLDLSRSTGWSVGAAGARIAGGVWTLPAAISPGAMFNALGDSLFDIIERYRIREIAMEAPMDIQASARVHTPMADVRQQLGLAAIVDYVGERTDIRVREVKVNDARREILGTSHGFGGTEGKAKIVKWCRDHGLVDMQNHNEADSEVVRLYACKVWGRRIAA